MKRNQVSITNERGDLTDTGSLWLADLMERHSRKLYYAHRAVEARKALHERIRESDEDGFVAIYSSGMDCDGGAWENKCERSNVPATVQAVDAAMNDIAAWADGPISMWVDRPSADYEESHRDLALEAFEDGHSHVLSSARFEMNG